MRAFIGFDLPENVRNILLSLQNKQVSKVAKVKWVAKKNFHLCLKFLPNLLEKDLEKVKDLLSQIKVKPFEVKLGDVGFFPNEININVVWIGLEPEIKIMELQQDVDDNLRELFKPEERFAVHVTLGRVKYAKDVELFRNLILSKDYDHVKFKVDSFKLYKTDLNKEGPRYTVVEKF